MSEAAETLSNLSREERRFPQSAAFAAQANVTADAYDQASADRLAYLGRAGSPAAVGRTVAHGSGVEAAVRQVVRRRRAERERQLCQPARRLRSWRSGRDPLRRRTRRHALDNLW